MHADLVKLGFTGSLNRVAAFARDWRADRQREQQTTGRGTFVPLSFSPGETFQFDWSDDFAILRESAPSFRWPISSYRIAGPFCCAPTWLTDGREARDVMLGLMKTCRKLGISFFAYLGDRLGLHGPDERVPFLPELVVVRPA